MTAEKKRGLLERVMRELPATATEETKDNFSQMDISRPLTANITKPDKLTILNLCADIMDEMALEEVKIQIRRGRNKKKPTEPALGLMSKIHHDMRQMRTPTLGSNEDDFHSYNVFNELKSQEGPPRSVAPSLLPFINRGLKAGKKSKKTKRRRTKRTKRRRTNRKK